MYNSPLEEFLDLTVLQTNPDYVSNLFKTAYSKNITIEEWNTFINQFQSLISRDSATYLGFKNVLEVLQIYQNFVNTVGVPYAENAFHIDPDKLKADTLYGSVEYLHGKKLDKVTSGPSSVYGVTSKGAQQMVPYAIDGNGKTLIYRDANGRARVKAPMDDEQIANKKYVDDKEVALTGYVDDKETALNERIDNTKTDLELIIGDNYSDTNAYIREVESIAKGANQAEAFTNYASMVEVLNNAPRDKYLSGQNFYISTLNVPDLWTYKAALRETYTYVSDEAFLAELKDKGYVKVGYYKLYPLETQKVDLTEYPKKEEVDIDIQTAKDDVVRYVNDEYYKTDEVDQAIDTAKQEAVNEATIQSKNYANTTFANVLKGTKSGKAVAIDDASPFEHEMSVKLSSKSGETIDFTSVKLQKQGKNIIPYPYEYQKGTTNGISYEVLPDGGVRMNGTATANTNINLHYRINLCQEGVRYFASGSRPDVALIFRAFVKDSNDSVSWATAGSKIANGVFPTGYYDTHISYYVYSGTTISNEVFYPMLCVADSEATPERLDYVPYITPTEYTPTADGMVEGVTSITPYTTLTTDNDDVIIDVEYNRDINKAFAELQEAIISLGGNV